MERNPQTGITTSKASFLSFWIFYLYRQVGVPPLRPGGRVRAPAQRQEGQRAQPALLGGGGKNEEGGDPPCPHRRAAIHPPEIPATAAEDPRDNHPSPFIPEDARDAGERTGGESADPAQVLRLPGLRGHHHVHPAAPR